MTKPLDNHLIRDDREPKRITPFSICIDVEFVPDNHFSGYRLVTIGRAEIGDKRLILIVRPGLEFTSAKWFYGLEFRLFVDAAVAVPVVNKANKD